MIPGICNQCGATIEVDNSKETAFCPYCGTKYITKAAINNYHVQNASIQHVDSINIYNVKTAESIIERAFIALSDSEFEQANKNFLDALSIDPYNWRAYWGLVLSDRRCLNAKEAKRLRTSLYNDKNFVHALEYAPDDKQKWLQSIENEIIKSYKYIHSKKYGYDIRFMSLIGISCIGIAIFVATNL